MKSDYGSGNGNKLIIGLIVTLVVILAGMSGLIISMNNSRSKKAAATTNVYTPQYGTVATSAYSPVTAPLSGATTAAGHTAPGASANNTTAPAATQAPAAQNADVSTWSKAQIIQYASDAVNQTKAYGGQLSVHHMESMETNIISITGGSLAQRMANALMSAVMKPTDEIWEFNGGYASDSEGAQQTLLLPNGKAFNLPESGVAAASASKSGENVVVNLTLVPETVDINTVPQYNSNAIGFLDVGSLNLSVLKVTSAAITYQGSTIRLTIRPDGYVARAEYTLPMYVSGSGTGMGISGNAEFDGAQTEIWELNW